MKTKSLPLDMFNKAFKIEVTALTGSYHFFIVTTVKASHNCVSKFIDAALNKAFIPMAMSEQEVKDPATVIRGSSLMMSEIMADVKRGELSDMYLSAPITRVKDQSVPIHP